MARKLGMDPGRVMALSTQLTAQLGLLDGVAAEVKATAWASLNPASYGIQPGGLVIAPWSIAGTQVASVLVHNASREAEVLAARLMAEVIAQQVASAPDLTAAFRDGALVRGVFRVVLAHPDALISLTPAQRAAWWSALSQGERDQLIKQYPLLIGNAEGLPYADRDAANRVALARMLADESLPGGQRRALEAIQAALDDAESRGEQSQLMMVDFPEGADPRAAIVYGDLDAASSIGILVPGMDNTVEKSMVDLGTAAYNLYLEQELIASKRADGQSHAVVAWMGYQTPGAFPDDAVLKEERAIVGGEYLSGSLSGIDAVRGDDPRVSVFAHSYGSRAATYALAGSGRADALVVFGSPGIAEPVTQASQLNVPAGEVYATRATADNVAVVGLVGSGNLSPLNPSFGAERFSSEGTSTHRAVNGHSMLLAKESNGEQYGYMDRGADSLYDMALIGLGQGGETR